MAQEFIKRVGFKLENQLRLREKRLYMQGCESYRDVLSSIYRAYPELENYGREEVVRNCSPKYYMNYHIDKCNVVKE